MDNNIFSNKGLGNNGPLTRRLKFYLQKFNIRADYIEKRQKQIKEEINDIEQKSKQSHIRTFIKNQT